MLLRIHVHMILASTPLDETKYQRTKRYISKGDNLCSFTQLQKLRDSCLASAPPDLSRSLHVFDIYIGHLSINMWKRHFFGSALGATL